MNKEIIEPDELVKCYNLAREIAEKWSDGIGINYDTTTLYNLLYFIRDSVDYDKDRIRQLDKQLDNTEYDLRNTEDEVYYLQNRISTLENEVGDQ